MLSGRKDGVQTPRDPELQHFESQGRVRVEVQKILLISGAKYAGTQQIEITTSKEIVRVSFGINSKYQTILLSSIIFEVSLFSKSLALTSLTLFPSPKQSKNTGANFTAGLPKALLDELTDFDCMTLSAPGNTSVTRTILFSGGRTDSSISHTRSPTFRTRSSSVAHLGCTFNLGNYSFAHLFQIVCLYA